MGILYFGMPFFYTKAMGTTTIRIIFMSLLAAEFCCSVFLEILNLRNLRKAEDTRPDDAEAYSKYDSSTLFQVLSYSRDKTYFALLSLTLSFLLTAILVVWKVPGKIEALFLVLSDSHYLTGIGTLFTVALMFSVPAVILGAWLHFVIEEQHGFNRMNLKLFIQDILKSALLSVLLGLPLSYAILWLVEFLGPLWWLYSFILVAITQLLISFLFPVLIAPLFFRFSPLEDGSLKERLQKLAQKTGFTFKSIQVMDGSRRSSHSNAFFSGFGSSRRIALFDTLIETLSEEQIEAVVAHELGHAKKGHIVRQLGSSLIILFCTFGLLGYLLDREVLFSVFGFQAPSVYALLVIVLFFSSPLTFWLSPVSSFFSRRREYAADAFAQDCLGDYRPLAEGLLKLQQCNKSNPVPHRIYSLFLYSHPTVPERISAMRERCSGESEKPRGC